MKIKTKRVVSYRTLKTGYVPYIRISGKYLEQFGFSIGNGFNVTFTDDKIVLQSVFQKKQGVKRGKR